MLRLNQITSVDSRDGVEVNVTQNENALIKFDSLSPVHTQSACFSGPESDQLLNN